MKSYTVRDIPDDQYKALRIIAAEMETSIDKAITIGSLEICPLTL